VNGFQIKGNVKGFDSYTIVIDSDGKQQMIYKHAISTIVPAKAVNFLSSNNNKKQEE
jgi:host factor-I protein